MRSVELSESANYQLTSTRVVSWVSNTLEERIMWESKMAGVLDELNDDIERYDICRNELEEQWEIECDICGYPMSFAEYSLRHSTRWERDPWRPAACWICRCGSREMFGFDWSRELCGCCGNSITNHLRRIRGECYEKRETNP